MKIQLRFKSVGRLVENEASEYELVSARRNAAFGEDISQALIVDLKKLAGFAQSLPKENWEMIVNKVETFPVNVTSDVFVWPNEPESIQIDVLIRVKGVSAKEAFERIVEIVEGSQT